MMKKMYESPVSETVAVEVEPFMGPSDPKVSGAVLTDTTTGTASPGPEMGGDDTDVDNDL